ncbi:hypothetical protein JY97_01110 [Alkalispirochaeta odontotermitis]|nr:hypothetical protein JY97_01110 [Alkalispirochaeta odontotermitis]
MAFVLVEMSIEHHKRGEKINLVLHKNEGINLDDLVQAQKVLRPRLEIEFNRENLIVEITSPGLTRAIKHPREYKIFRGKQMKLLHEGRWIHGMLKEANNLSVMIATETGELAIPIKQIKKAKLSNWQ